MTKKQLALIDGNSLLYRSFYALPALTNAQGTPTNAVYGFLLMLSKLYEDMKPDYIAVAFDKGRITFRNDIFADYKGHRPDAPEELLPQFALIREVLQTLGIAIYENEGYEADDLIGTISNKLEDVCDVNIITGDRDTLQLVSDKTTVYLTRKGITNMDEMTPETVFSVYGITPEQVVDMKALMGDSSDNIPGVPGVGEKTAAKLLAKFDNLDSVYERIDEVGGKKLPERLVENKELAYLSQKLAKIDANVPFEFALEEMVPQARTEEIETLFGRLGFRNMLPKLQASGVVPIYNAEESLFTDLKEEIYNIKRNISSDFLSDVNEVVVALKTTGSVPEIKAEAVAIAVDDEIYFWEGNAAKKAIETILASEVKIVTEHAKRLYAVTGINKSVAGVLDVTVASYILDPSRTSYPLTYLADKYGFSMLREDADTATELAAETNLLRKVAPKIIAELEENGATDLYFNIEMPLIQVLAAMEQAGIRVDTERLAEIRNELNDRIHSISNRIYEEAEEEFNISSPKQLGTILFEKLKLPPGKKTKTGYSTDAEVLQGLYDQHTIVPLVLEYRALTKLVSTYLDGMEELISPLTTRLHTTFNQTVTATGRLSSSDPNLQNIPVRTPEGRRIRSIFVPGEDYDAFLSADYSQIELRVLAHISGDKGLKEAFLNKEDIHRRTAAEVLHIEPEEVTEYQRSHAKAVNFGIIYGISDYGLARDLGITRKEAADYIKKYLERYPKVEEFMHNIVAEAKEKERVETLFGRFRRLPEIHSRNFNRRSFAERTALNTPIQGTAADIMKIAMNRVHWALQRAGYKSRILLQVHDELVLEIRDEEREEVTVLLKKHMEDAAQLDIPLVVEIHYGKNWEDTD